MILVIAEQRGGKSNRATWEAIAGAQQLAAEAGNQPLIVSCSAPVSRGVAAELAAAEVKEVITVEDAALEPTPPTATRRRCRTPSRSSRRRRRSASYLPDARFRAEARGPPRSRAS